jgi:hypothetical protein
LKVQIRKIFGSDGATMYGGHVLKIIYKFLVETLIGDLANL